MGYVMMRLPNIRPPRTRQPAITPLGWLCILGLPLGAAIVLGVILRMT